MYSYGDKLFCYYYLTKKLAIEDRDKLHKISPHSTGCAEWRIEIIEIKEQ